MNISIVHDSGIPIPFDFQHGHTDPNLAANTTQVTFNAKVCGQYKINILVDNKHITGSPFLRTFLPGK